MVGHILEYHPAITKLKEIIAQGELGNLLYIYSQRLNLGKVRQEENILWSFAPHDIAVISSLVGQEAIEVKASGGNYLQPNITDIAIINLNFANGIKSHIFVSWLNPYKEQKLVVIGDRQMAVFNDTLPEGKLKIYNQRIEWREGIPTPHKEGETIIPLPEAEPLKLECQHFLTCIKTRQKPLTDGENGLKVLKVLAACGGVGE